MSKSPVALCTLSEEDEGKITKHYDDRLLAYDLRQLQESPRAYYKAVKRYWVIGAVLNLIALGLIGYGNWITLGKNASNPLIIKRIDGLTIEQSKDSRYEVMTRNALKRQSLANKNQ
jgi:hypothetical protein